MKTQFTFAFILTATLTVAVSAWAKPDFGKSGMVVSASALASQAGIKILKQGGNAVDGAVATAFALSVTRPYYAALGGGGFMLVRMNEKISVIDHRERAPLKTTADMFLKAPKKDASEIGGLAVATPGNVMGLFEAHKKFGRLPWSKCIEPAIELATKGFMVDHEIFELTRDHLKNFSPGGLKFWTHNGKPLEVGDWLKQPQLADALRLIQRKGAGGFYSGVVADDLIATIKKEGGIMTQADLTKYKVRWLNALYEKVFGADIYTMPPPSSGGTLMLAEMKMAEKLKLQELKPWSATEYHLLGEIMRRAFFDRQYIADPDYMKIKPDQIFSDERVQQWAATISKDKKTDFDKSKFEINAPRQSGHEGTQTTHYSVVDKDGNAVSATTTLNGNFGSCVWTERFGIALNNEMDDFTTKPGEANIFGLTQSKLNTPAPLKTPLSSMTPTIIEKNHKLFMVVGSPGGPRIINAVFQVAYHALTSSFDIYDIVQAPRVHHQYGPDTLYYDRTLNPEVLEKLNALGHQTKEGKIAKVYAIRLTPDGLLEGSWDSRGEGGAVGY